MIMLSALQHAVFCMRQCALIHLEGIWTENHLTATGRILHERVDNGMHETRRDVRLATALRLVSRRLGVIGIADMVEFHRVGEGGAPLPGLSGRWMPFPVEYKHGKPKIHRADEVQLCAQAMCLEEMLNVEVPSGALFYGTTRRRMEVRFDAGFARRFGCLPAVHCEIGGVDRMLVLVSYDVSTVTPAGQRRLRRIAKKCLDYGIRVQNSVFECNVDWGQWAKLKADLEGICDKETDSLRYYYLGRDYQRRIEHFGAKPALDVEAPLVL